MKRQSEAIIPTYWGNFTMIAYADSESEKMPHLALVHESFDASKITPVRIHSECLTGDIFQSKRCDCGAQLHRAMEIAAHNGGVVIYLRQEGRGIGLIKKLDAYQLQDNGLNTIDANTHQGLPADARVYDDAIEILKDLDIKKIDLLTNNPLKIKALEESQVLLRKRIPLEITPTETNKNYLNTKRDLMGHLLKN